MIKALVKRVGMAMAPRATLELLSARSQRLIMRIERDTGTLSSSQCFVETYGRQVLRGPFKGLVYPERTAAERNLVHRLVGSYESEMYPWIEEIVEHDYDMILDVGTADGFYAIGFAMRMPATQVVGFDTDRWARIATQNLALENRVDNVQVKSMCTTAWIRDHVKPNSLIFSDCEGYEMTLFDPEAAPILTECDMVIELHERAEPGVESTIRSRFSNTHDVRVVTYVEHDPTLFHELEIVDPEKRAAVISEGRGGPQNSIFLTRKRQTTPAKTSF